MSGEYGRIHLRITENEMKPWDQEVIEELDYLFFFISTTAKVYGVTAEVDKSIKGEQIITIEPKIDDVKDLYQKIEYLIYPIFQELLFKTCDFVGSTHGIEYGELQSKPTYEQDKGSYLTDFFDN